MEYQSIDDVRRVYKIIIKWKLRILLFAILATSFIYIGDTYFSKKPKIIEMHSAYAILKVGTIAGYHTNDNFSLMHYILKRHLNNEFKNIDFEKFDYRNFYFKNFIISRYSEPSLGMLYYVEFSANEEKVAIDNLNYLIKELQQFQEENYQRSFALFQQNITNAQRTQYVPASNFLNSNTQPPQIIKTAEIRKGSLIGPESGLPIIKKCIVVFIVLIFIGVFIAMVSEYVIEIINSKKTTES